MPDQRSQIRFIIYLHATIIIFSLFCFYINDKLYQFSGNQYLPADFFQSLPILALMYLASRLGFGAKSPANQFFFDFILYYSAIAMVLLLTTAVQFTPFRPIDEHIFRWLGPELNQKFLALMLWTQNHDLVFKGLKLTYANLQIELLIIPLILIGLRQRQSLYEFLILILLSALIGFTFYYLFPSSGPGTVFPAEYFSPAQLATHLKFNEVHQSIPPSTLEGGMIALPSYHVIWAWLCTFALRQYKTVFIMLCFYNGILLLSCVLLGWHYFIDPIGSLLLLLLTHALCIMHQTASKRRKARAEDHRCIN